MAKKFTSRDKVVNKMTKDGLEELNVTKGTKENISNRIKDISLERKKDKLDLKTENIEKNAKNKRQKRQQKIIKNQSESVDSYSKVNNPGYEKGNLAASSDISIKVSSSNSNTNRNTNKANKSNMDEFTFSTISSSSNKSNRKYSDKNESKENEDSSRLSNKTRNNKYRTSKKSTDDLSHTNIKSQAGESRFKLKDVSDKTKLENRSLSLSNSSIRNLENEHNKISLKHNKLKSKQRHGLRENFEDEIESDDSSLQSDTFKSVRSTKNKLQKGVRYLNNRKRSKKNSKYKEEIAKHKKIKHNSMLRFEENNLKKAGKFLLGAGSYTATFSKDSALASIENDNSLHSDTLKYLREGSSIASSKVNSIRKFSNYINKSKTQKDLNKQKSALNQKNKEVMQHSKKRNITKMSSEEKKKIQKGLYKKQYAKAYKNGETKKISEVFQIAQQRLIVFAKTAKAALVKVVSAIALFIGTPVGLAFLIMCLLMFFISLTGVGGAYLSAIVYQSSDVEVTKTNGYFSELEVDLQIDIDDTQKNYSGYDEYEYALENIGHDPHMIASWLSAKFPQGFKLEEIHEDIKKLFDDMYTLERIPRTETRGSGSSTYTVEILKTVLKVKPLKDAIYKDLNLKEQLSYMMFFEVKGCFTFMKNPISEEWKLKVIKRFGYIKDPDTGEKVFYPAIDIEPPEDGKVFAMVKGIIHFGNDEFGEYLEILTEAGNRVRYSNVSNFLLEDGDEIKAGDELCSLKEPASDSYIGAFLRIQLIDKFDNYLDPYFYIRSNTDKLSDAYIVDFSQPNNHNNNPDTAFPSGVDLEDYDAWVKALLEEAAKHLGKSYVFGSNGPDTFDCSSFVCYTFTHSGVKNMPRTTAQALYNSTERVSKENLRPGDLVFFTGTYDAGRPVTHIGIYVGNGTMIHAGDPVQYANLNSNYWQNHYYGGGRVIP